MGPWAVSMTQVSGLSSGLDSVHPGSCLRRTSDCVRTQCGGGAAPNKQTPPGAAPLSGPCAAPRRLAALPRCRRSRLAGRLRPHTRGPRHQAAAVFQLHRPSDNGASSPARAAPQRAGGRGQRPSLARPCPQTPAVPARPSPGPQGWFPATLIRPPLRAHTPQSGSPGPSAGPREEGAGGIWVFLPTQDSA